MADLTKAVAESHMLAPHQTGVRELSKHVLRAAGAGENAIHRAADAHRAKFSVAIRYAFAMARKKVGTGKPNVEPVLTALRQALEDVLPATLLKVVAAGGVAGVALLLGQLRTAGDVEGHAFHGNQWTHGSALAGGNTLELTERGDTTYVHVRFKSGSASSMGRVEKKSGEYHAKGEDVHISTHGTKHEAVRAVIERSGFKALGDVEGHAFHGNQYTDAFGTSDKYVYHISDPTIPLSSFETHGIKPSKTGYGGPGVYMAHTPEKTQYYEELGKGRLFRVDKQKLIEKFGRYPDQKTGVEYDEHTGEVVLGGSRSIPRAFIEVKHGNDWRALGDVEGHAFHGNQWTGSGNTPVQEAHNYAIAADFIFKHIVETSAYAGAPPGDYLSEEGATILGRVHAHLSEQITRLTGQRYAEFNPDQARDEHGQWTHEGGTGTPHGAKKSIHNKGHVVESWYDKKSRSWITQLKDPRGFLVGDAEYNGTKAGMNVSHSEMMKQAGLRTAVGPLTMRFDAQNHAVIEWARKHAAELVTQVTDTTRDRIRLAVEELQTEGDWEFAHDRIAAAVGDQDRADLIARHETMLAAGEGQRQAWDQATEEGLLTGDEQRGWIVTPDEKLCPICEGLEDKVADLDGMYMSDDGDEYDGPPAHVQCRCTEGIVALRGAASFDEAEHPRDGNGQWATSDGAPAPPVDESLARVREALATAPEGTQLVIGSETYSAIHDGTWSAPGGQTLTSQAVATQVPRLVDAGLVSGAVLSPTQQAEMAAVLASKLKKKSKLPMVVFAAGAGADWTSTGFALAHGAHEDNPLINWIKSPPAMIAAGAGIDAVGMWAWARTTHDHTKLQAVGFYAATILRGYLVVHNIRGTRQGQPTRGFGTGTPVGLK